MKKWSILLCMALTFLLGIWAAKWYFSKMETHEKVEASVLLEQVREVAKLIAVEGQFAEIYKHEDFYGYDLPGFRKKALVRVKATVHVGYDLERMVFSSSDAMKTIHILNVPYAEILAVEHDLDYYDIQEGIFNSFSTEDYNKINDAAKDLIYRKAQESSLFETAQKQRESLFETMRFIVEGAGWKLNIERADIPEPIPLLPD